MIPFFQRFACKMKPESCYITRRPYDLILPRKYNPNKYSS